jgi:hypothetical protein
MAQIWPSTLQQLISESNFGYEIADTALRTDMDIGPQKVRRRFTKSVNTMSGSIYVTTTEFTTFYTFYNTTLNGGTLPFEFEHPITKELKEWRFKGPARVQSIGGGNFTIDFTWEELP